MFESLAFKSIGHHVRTQGRGGERWGQILHQYVLAPTGGNNGIANANIVGEHYLMIFFSTNYMNDRAKT